MVHITAGAAGVASAAGAWFIQTGGVDRGKPWWSQVNYGGARLFADVRSDNMVPSLFAPRSESANRTPADSLPGQIDPWPNRSLALSLPAPFVPWPFHSLEISLPGTFAQWL